MDHEVVRVEKGHLVGWYSDVNLSCLLASASACTEKLTENVLANQSERLSSHLTFVKKGLFGRLSERTDFASPKNHLSGLFDELRRREQKESPSGNLGTSARVCWECTQFGCTDFAKPCASLARYPGSRLRYNDWSPTGAENHLDNNQPCTKRTPKVRMTNFE